MTELKETEILHPNSFYDITMLVERVKKREGVIVDFEGLSEEITIRMLDFLCGATFALNAKIKKIKKKTYILIPKGIKIKRINL